jgi:polyhydroxyalkanoate synthesis regulator phasin
MNWGLLEHSKKTVFKIPVGDMSREDAEKLVKKLIKQWDPHKFLMKERKQKIDKITNKINEEKRPI